MFRAHFSYQNVAVENLLLVETIASLALGYKVNKFIFSVFAICSSLLKGGKNHSKLRLHKTRANNLGLKTAFQPDNRALLSFHSAFFTLSGSRMREVTFTYIHIYIQGIFVLFSVTQTGFIYKLANKVSHIFLYQGGGRFLIGQEQDNTSTSFNDIESFVGEITLLQIWNHVIGDSEVRAMYTFCEDVSSRAEAGSLVLWPEFRFSLTGTGVVLNSSFCSGKYPTLQDENIHRIKPF